jgi:hypothetical protein
VLALRNFHAQEELRLANPSPIITSERGDDGVWKRRFPREFLGMPRSTYWMLGEYKEADDLMERVRVFLSSTQADLQPERNRAEAVVGRLGHDCLRAETHDAPGRSPEDVCRTLARDCDIYVGIFGGRYGYVVPGLGCSATEMEYREARTSNPGKVFVYVKEAEPVDDDQLRFLSEVQDFSQGYFRHERFHSAPQLAKQLERDLITWTSVRIREALAKEIEVRALRDKVAHMSRVMGLYGIPEDLR